MAGETGNGQNHFRTYQGNVAAVSAGSSQLVSAPLMSADGAACDSTCQGSAAGFRT